MARGRAKGGLEAADLGACPRDYLSLTLGTRLIFAHNSERISRAYASLMRALIKTFWGQLTVISLIDVTAKCLVAPMQMIAIGWLIRHSSGYLKAISPVTAKTITTNGNANATTTNQTASTSIGSDLIDANEELSKIYWAVGYVIGSTWLVHTLCHLAMLLSCQLAIKFRVAASQLIYRKSLRLSKQALSGSTAGQMIGLLSNDVNRFEEAVLLASSLVTAPLQALLVVVVMWQLFVGLKPALASLLIMLVCLAIQSSLGKCFRHFRFTIANRTDQRVRLVNEIIIAIRLIKMYAWEAPFKRLVQAARERELASVAVLSQLKAINQTIYFVSSKLIVFSALICFVFMGNKLEPEIVFAVIGLANLVRMSLTFFLPNSVASLAEMLASCVRIDRFLALPEIQLQPANYRHLQEHDQIGHEKYALKLSNVFVNNSSRDNDDNNNTSAHHHATVKGLSMLVKRGQLVAVTGRVGAGKTSLLNALIGEQPVASGRIEVNGTLSYVAQEPWLVPASVQKNILLGQELDIERYERVLAACRIGPLGPSSSSSGSSSAQQACSDSDPSVSLSQEEKARVALARCLYHKADIYILDDPFALLDVAVAQYIFQAAILDFLGDKTVILVTQQVQFLAHANKVLLMQAKEAAVFGSYEQIWTTTNLKHQAPAVPTDHDCDEKQQNREASSPHESCDDKSEQQLTIFSPKFTEQATEPSDEHNGLHDAALEPAHEIGYNKRSYSFYINCATSLWGLLVFLSLNLVSQAIFHYTDFFLSFWSNSVQRKGREGANFKPEAKIDSLDLVALVSIYAALVVSLFISALLRASSFYFGTCLASRRIHEQLFEALIYAPLEFFDFKPIGVLLNRISRDIGLVDESLPTILLDVIASLLSIMGILIIVVISDVRNLALVLIYALVLLRLRAYCSTTIVRLKQLESIQRSPIFSHLSLTLGGLASIRTLKLADLFASQFESHQDSHSSAYFAFICAGRFLSLLLDLATLVLVSLALGLKICLFDLQSSQASAIGLLVSQLVLLPIRTQWGSRQLVELESQMTSVQRVHEFIETEPEETQVARRRRTSCSAASDLHDPVSNGRLVFEQVSLSYSKPLIARGPAPDQGGALASLSFVVQPGEKVAVLGSTGAGKSSLLAALLRLYPFEGRILVDGQDIAALGLSQLRAAIAVVPQDPYLFGGSLRRNLDPFGEHSDGELWAALDAVNLLKAFESTTTALGFHILESGANLSMGQRQLVCLARAIVRRSRIVVLDEANLGLDPETDKQVHEAMHLLLSHCTVLSLTQNIEYAFQSDKILVLNGAKQLDSSSPQASRSEFGDPYELMRDPASLFSKLIEAQQGPRATRVRRLVVDAHYRRLPSDAQWPD